jgi:hypothetical protein
MYRVVIRDTSSPLTPHQTVFFEVIKASQEQFVWSS